MQPHDIHLQLSRGCAKSDITIDFGMSGYTALCRRCGWARRRPPFPMLQGRLVLPSAPMSRRSAAEIERDEALNDGREVPGWVQARLKDEGGERKEAEIAAAGVMVTMPDPSTLTDEQRARRELPGITVTTGNVSPAGQRVAARNEEARREGAWRSDVANLAASWEDPLESACRRLATLHLNFVDRDPLDAEDKFALAYVLRHALDGVDAVKAVREKLMHDVWAARAELARPPTERVATLERELAAMRAPEWNAHVALSPACGARAVDEHALGIVNGERSCFCGWHAPHERRCDADNDSDAGSDY